MKILKLSRAEMQKIFAKPGIYIMSAIFILILAAASFVFDMAPRSNDIVTIPGTTVSAINTHYMTPQNLESQGEYNKKLQGLIEMMQEHYLSTTPLMPLYNKLDQMYTYYTNYSLKVNTSEPDSSITNDFKAQLKTSVNEFRDLYNTMFNKNYREFLTSQKNHIALLSFIDRLDNTIPSGNEPGNVVVLNNIDALDFLNVLDNHLDQMLEYTIEDETYDQINNYYLPLVQARLVSISQEVANFATDNSASDSPEDLLAIKKLISKYKLTVEQFETIALNKIYLELFSDISNTQARNFMGFENINFYELKENLTKNLYLFEAEEFSFNYANPFSTSSPSNSTQNAFDFAFFAMELFSFIIIIYVVVLGAGMIAGEEANGTMKLLAMRPYKRYKIFLGKMLSAIKVGVMFLIIGGAVSVLTGTYLFGATSKSILAVFNGEYIAVMSPYVMFLIYLLTLFFKMLFYIVIAVSISSIFKSYTGAVTISILIYFVSMILTFITGAIWLKYVPLANTNLFKYFGSSFIKSEVGISGLDTLLNPPMLLSTDFIFAIISLATTMFILLGLALSLFSRRDLK